MNLAGGDPGSESAEGGSDNEVGDELRLVRSSMIALGVREFRPSCCRYYVCKSILDEGMAKETVGRRLVLNSAEPPTIL